MQESQSNKEAQVWLIDIIVAIGIFFIVLAIYLTFSYRWQDDSGYAKMYDSAILLSSNLLSAGQPINWTVSSVQEIGLTNGNYRIDENKLSNFVSLPYVEKMSKLRSSYNFLFYFEKQDGNILNISGRSFFGSNDYNIYNLSESNIVTIKRVVIYNSSIVRMAVVIWR